MGFKGKIENSSGDIFELDHQHDEQYLSKDGGALSGPLNVDYVLDSEGKIMIGKGQNETNVGIDSRTTVLRGSAVNVKRVSGSQATWEEIVSSKDVTTIKKITLAQYNALSTKDSKTLYLVVG